MASVTGIAGSISSLMGSWSGLIINLLVSTLVGGVVFLIVAKLIAGRLGDNVGIGKVFLAVFIINVINIPIIWGLTIQAIAAIPFTGFLFPFLPLLVWFFAIKMAFGGMSISHILLMAVIGYVLSIFVIPTLVLSVSGFLPSKI